MPRSAPRYRCPGRFRSRTPVSCGYALHQPQAQTPAVMRACGPWRVGRKAAAAAPGGEPRCVFRRRLTPSRRGAQKSASLHKAQVRHPASGSWSGRSTRPPALHPVTTGSATVSGSACSRSSASPRLLPGNTGTSGIAASAMRIVLHRPGLLRCRARSAISVSFASSIGRVT